MKKIGLKILGIVIILIVLLTIADIYMTDFFEEIYDFITKKVTKRSRVVYEKE